MMRHLPDEILVNIARQCVDPYSITAFKTADTDDVWRLSFKPFKNVRLTSKLFATELRKALRENFSGKLVLHESASEFFNSQIEKDLGPFAGILSRIREVQIQCAPSYTSYFRQLNFWSFSNLQRLVILKHEGDLEPLMRYFDIEISRLFDPKSDCHDYHDVVVMQNIVNTSVGFYASFDTERSGKLVPRTHEIDINIVLTADLPSVKRRFAWKYSGKLCEVPTEDRVERSETRLL